MNAVGTSTGPVAPFPNRVTQVTAIIVCCAASLVCPVHARAEGSPVHPLARDVRIVAPGALAASSSGTALPDHVHPDSVGAPVGSGLVAYYGCAVCHDLPGGRPSRQMGPSLDGVGSKLKESWLRSWLGDRAASGGRMPRVILSEPEVEAVVAFLMDQRVEGLDPAPAGDVAAGAALHRDNECADCHTAEDGNSPEAPPLEDLGVRMTHSWLVAFLVAPDRMVPDTEMPSFDLTGQAAADLASYLLGLPEDLSEPYRPDPALIRKGLDTFVDRGCGGCHRISRYVRTLADGLASPDAAGHHAKDRPGSPGIRLSDAQSAALARWLQGPPDVPPGVPGHEFLRAFWKSPVPLNGSPPASFGGNATGLGAGSCGACHVAQHGDWSTSLHSRAMGPGVAGQFHDTQWNAPAFAHSCQQCHGVSGEQHAALPDGDGGFEVNYRFDPGLHREGITCINCHVRRHVRFGPPPASRSPAAVWRGVGHAGGVESPAFEGSEFCAGCHQFGPKDRRVAGKLLQDTHAQWQVSVLAAEGKTCQQCHMPGRRHLWRGIHHGPTVRDAVSLEIGRDSAAAEIRLSNIGAGHHLPTYVTPKLFVRAEIVSFDGRTRPSTAQVRAVGWEVELGPSRGKEIYDTRIPAGGMWIWRYPIRGAADEDSLRVTVEVHPDHFYLRFFERYERAGLSPAAAAMIDSAETRARGTPYLLLRTTTPL